MHVLKKYHYWRVVTADMIETYHLNRRDTHERAKLPGAAVDQVPLWFDEEGRLYVVEMREVKIEGPSADEVMAKLTAAEKKALREAGLLKV